MVVVMPLDMTVMMMVMMMMMMMMMMPVLLFQLVCSPSRTRTSQPAWCVFVCLDGLYVSCHPQSQPSRDDGAGVVGQW